MRVLMYSKATGSVRGPLAAKCSSLVMLCNSLRRVIIRQRPQLLDVDTPCLQLALQGLHVTHHCI